MIKQLDVVIKTNAKTLVMIDEVHRANDKGINWENVNPQLFAYIIDEKDALVKELRDKNKKLRG